MTIPRGILSRARLPEEADMLRKKAGIDLGRSFTRTSGRVANTFKRSRFNGKGSATVVATAAGIAGLYAAMRFIRRAPGAGATFDAYPDEHGGWTVKTSKTFETRSQALEAARRATAALRSESVSGNPLPTPESSVKRPWSGSAGPLSAERHSRT
jgi:hypothetical protein